MDIYLFHFSDGDNSSEAIQRLREAPEGAASPNEQHVRHWMWPAPTGAGIHQRLHEHLRVRKKSDQPCELEDDIYDSIKDILWKKA